VRLCLALSALSYAEKQDCRKLLSRRLIPILSRGFLEGEDEDFGWVLPAKGEQHLHARLAARLQAGRQPKKKVY
jgi:hypothetical protein